MPPDTNSRGLLRVAEERIDRDWNTYTKLAEIGCVRNPVEDYIVVTYPRELPWMIYPKRREWYIQIRLWMG